MPLEKILRSREKAADLRDEISTAREEAVSIREKNILIRENQVFDMKDPDLIVDNLLKINADLVISGLRAQAANKELEGVVDGMWHASRHDKLTDLPNRLLLTERLAEALIAAAKKDAKLAILFLDLDKFKKVNDTFGHSVGDRLLQEVAKRLRNSVRNSDTVSRHGGDEFVILLDSVMDENSVSIIADKICRTVTSPYEIDQEDIRIGISMGICMYPTEGDNPEILLQNADAAMYEAKNTNDSHYRFFKQKPI